ncbi:MAG: cytochrome b/b6 domain-containing protein [Novosphingobium sp.]
MTRTADPAFRAAPPARYPLPMRLLHWLRAALILGLLGLGLYMTSLPDADPAKHGQLYPLHKGFGMIALAVVVTALLTRARSVIPAEVEAIAQWERALATFVHRGLMVLSVAVPVFGYCMSSSYSHGGVPFFGLDLPRLVPVNDAVSDLFTTLHNGAAWTLLGFAVLHILGALKHRVIDSNPAADVLGRML